MVSQRRDDRALHAFINDLVRLKIKAGDPSLSQLRQISERTSAERGLRPLPESTTNDILNHRRIRPPEWSWVASFVAACRTYVRETGLDPEQVGLGTTQEWLDRFCAARSDRYHDVAPARLPVTPPSHHLPTDAVAEAADHGRSRPVPVAPSAGGTAPPPARLPEQWYRETYGRTGGRLYRHAAEREPSAAYRLGILLLCDGIASPAREWLRGAAQTGHEDAALVIEATPGSPRVADAADNIGRDYERSGSLSSAMIFYERAAQHGHAEAAFHLERICAQRGRHAEASRWFPRAHDDGPDDSQRERGALAQKAPAPWRS